MRISTTIAPLTALRLLYLLFSLLLMFQAQAQSSLVYTNDLEDLPTGQYSDNDLKEALGVKFCNGCDEGRVYVTNTPDRGKVLDIRYPRGQVKPSNSGMQTRITFPGDQSYEELYLSYWVYFPEDFEFRAGGKLPGLMCNTQERNMTLRLMWRYDGLVEFYVHYNPNPARPDYQASINWSLLDPYEEPNGNPQPDQVKFQRGKWNHIEMYYKLNTPGQNDGIMRGWLDGKLAVDIRDNGNFRMADEGDIRMNTLFVSTFFGGSDENFQPQKDVQAYFDDFKVSQTRIGSGIDLPPNPIPDGERVFSFKKQGYDYYVDSGDGAQNQQPLVLSEPRSTVNQQWVEIDVGNGFYAYKKKGTDFAIDGGRGGRRGQTVKLYAYNRNNQNQHWKKIPVGDGHYVLQKRNAPQFAIDGGNGAQDNQGLYLWDINFFNVNQQWKFEPVNPSARPSARHQQLVTAPVTMYPNPVSDRLYLKNLPETSYQIAVYNHRGQLLYDRAVQPHSKEEALPVGDLRQGIYLLKVISQNGITTQKFVKQ